MLEKNKKGKFESSCLRKPRFSMDQTARGHTVLHNLIIFPGPKIYVS